MDSPAKIEQEIAKLCKGVDKKTDAMMLMSPDYNWDQFLTPAPMAIALMGDLILISGYNKDFKLTDKPPAGGFKHIKYPDSFRASLVQVSNAGWDAFDEAHKNMYQIQLKTERVDSYVKLAANCLFKGTEIEIEQILPTTLKKIVAVADDSLELAEKIEDKFVSVMQLTGELLEACTAAKGRNEEKNSETEKAIKVAQVEAERRQKEKEEQKRRLEMMEKEVERAHQDFRDAMDDAPSTSELVGLAIGDALISNVRGITSVAAALTPLIAGPAGVALAAGLNQANAVQSKSGTETSNKTPDNVDSDFDSKMAEYTIYQKVGSLTGHVETLNDICTGGANGKPDLKRVSTGGVELVKRYIEKIRSQVEEKIESEVQTKVLDICKRSTNVCDGLQKMIEVLNQTKETDTDATLETVKSLRKECRKLNAKASKMTRKNPLDSKSPAMSKQQPTGNNPSILKNVVEASRGKTEMAKATLTDARNRQDKATEIMAANNEKLMKVLKEMAGLELDKIDFEAIAATLVKGINALAQVREQWGKLVKFFHMLSSLIKCCLHTYLHDFVDTVKDGRTIKTSSGSMQLSSFMKDTIFEQAAKANQVSYVVNMVSATYVEISNKYLMDRITSLGRLIAMDHKTQQNEIQKARDELYKGCTEAQEAIKNTVVDQKEEFSRTIAKRLDSIRKLEESMPAIEETKLSEIKQSVADGFKDDELDDML